MKRIYLIAVPAVLLVFFSSCGAFLADGPTGVTEQTSGYIYTESVTTTSAPIEELSTEEESGSEAASGAEEQTGGVPSTVPAQPTETAQTASQPVSEAPEIVSKVDLSIAMPDANGKMQVDNSAENRFIAKVSKERGIDASLLAAVYSVPESGQNYVFEFTSASGRDVQNIRRVFLLDAAANITSVAAVNTSEREGISSTENWFCMNVLIKKVVFPAISGQF